MNFIFPLGLWLTLIVPILIALYIWAQRRRQKYALRYASLSLVKEALGRGPGIRRHVPPALFLASLFFMTVAVARWVRRRSIALITRSWSVVGDCTSEASPANDTMPTETSSP